MLVAASIPGHNFGTICRMVDGAPSRYPDAYSNRTLVISL